MMTDNDLLALGVLAKDTPELMSAYTYDAYAHLTNLHTDADGSDTVQHGFSIDNAGHGPCSCTADTTTWHAYDHDVHYYGYRYYSPSLGRWLSRDPILEKAFQGTRQLAEGVAKEQIEIRRWQKMLIKQGSLREESVREGGIIPPENRSQLEYVFVDNSPVDRIDVLGLGYCGSAGNEQWVPELWFGGAGGPCDKHDDCFGTCGYGQEYCNGLFLANMVRACPLWPPWETATCVAAASWYYAAVQNLGRTAFCAAQKGCCPKGEPLWGSCP